MAARKTAFEKVFKQGLGDPRGAAERTAGLVNRALQKAPAVRRYDDSPTVMARNKARKK